MVKSSANYKQNGEIVGERLRVLYKEQNIIYEIGILASRLPEWKQKEELGKIKILKVAPFILGEGFTQEDRIDG